MRAMVKFATGLLALLALAGHLTAGALDYLYWLPFQAIPSLKVTELGNETNSGLSWEVAPLFYSFHPNRFVSHWHSFKVNPVHRQRGGLELFGEAEFYQQQDWLYRSGLRVFLPLAGQGEALGLLVGASYIRQLGENGVGAEVGFSTLFSLLTVKFNYNWFVDARYSTSVNLRYF